MGFSGGVGPPAPIPPPEPLQTPEDLDRLAKERRARQRRRIDRSDLVIEPATAVTSSTPGPNVPR